MATITNQGHAVAPGMNLSASARTEIRRWLAAELEGRVPGSPHEQLAETLLRALTKEQPRPRLGRVILRQEVWRLLVTLRRSREDNSGTITEFETIIPGLTRKMEEIGVGRETTEEVEGRLSEALEDLRGWPLV